MEEQDIRIEARNWCGKIDTDRGASENQVENIALHFYNKAKKEVFDDIDKVLVRDQHDVDIFKELKEKHLGS